MVFAVNTSSRGGEAGPTFAQVKKVAAVGAITAPNETTVAGSDPALVGATAIQAVFDGPPSSVHLCIVGAWLSDPTTGAWAVRFSAGGANYAGANENILLQVLQTG